MSELLATLSSSELTEWMAFDTIDPMGEGRADLRNGMVVAAIVNHSMNPPKQPARPSDFMPFVKSSAPAPVVVPDPVAHSELIATTLFGDKVKRNGTR